MPSFMGQGAYKLLIVADKKQSAGAIDQGLFQTKKPRLPVAIYSNLIVI